MRASFGNQETAKVESVVDVVSGRLWPSALTAYALKMPVSSEDTSSSRSSDDQARPPARE